MVWGNRKWSFEVGILAWVHQDLCFVASSLVPHRCHAQRHIDFCVRFLATPRLNLWWIRPSPSIFFGGSKASSSNISLNSTTLYEADLKEEINMSGYPSSPGVCSVYELTPSPALPHSHWREPSKEKNRSWFLAAMIGQVCSCNASLIFWGWHNYLKPTPTLDSASIFFSGHWLCQIS